MSNSPYSNFSKEELILRDHLAIDRTILANENTFLAYIRTCLALLISGASLLKFFDLVLMHILGWVLIFIGISILAIGTIKFKKMRQEINNIRNG